MKSFRALSALLAGLVALPGSAARAAPPESGATLSYLAQRAREREHFESAARMALEAFEKTGEPRLLKNAAGALRSLGRFKEAHALWQAVVDHPKTRTSMRAEARVLMAEVAPLLDSASIDFGGVGDGAFVQLDGKTVPSVELGAVVTPTAHLVCVTSQEASTIACYAVVGVAGERQLWPPNRPTASRVSVRLDPQSPPRSIEIAGTPILGDFSRVTTLELDPGPTTLSIAYRDGPAQTRTVVLEPGASVTLAALTTPPPEPAPSSPEPVAPSPALAAPSPAAVASDVSVSVEPVTEPASMAGPWSLVGTGAVATAVGAGLLIYGEVLRNPGDRVTQAQAAADWDQADTLDTIGWSVLGVGAAALIGGLVWRYTGAPDAAIADAPALEPLVLFSPGQGLVGVQGAF